MSPGETDGCAVYRTYPAPEWLAEACNGRVATAWLKARHEPYWRQPIGIGVRFRFPSPPYRGAERLADAECDVGAPRLIAEIARYAGILGERTRVSEIHWSVKADALDSVAARQIRDAIDDHFDVIPGARFTIRIDTSPDALRILPQLYELGVTDLHIAAPAPDQIRSWVRAARKIGFPSIAVDVRLTDSARTRACVYEAILKGATRIVIRRAARPAHARASRDERLNWQQTVSALNDARYQRVAVDVYALPGDTYAVASRRGGLFGQPFGYTTHSIGVLLALGAAAIGYVGAFEYQNHRHRGAYAGALDSGKLPIERGLVLTRDDLLRRAIIMGLLSRLSVDIKVIETAYSMSFQRDLAIELKQLHALERAGLVTIDEQEIRITAAGQIDCGRVCDVFDRYARSKGRTVDNGRR